MDRVLFKSSQRDWITNPALFERLDAVFHFTLDVCADASNTLCEAWYSEAENALVQNWTEIPGFAWMNPPYGRHVIKWVHKMHGEYMDHGKETVAILPVRSETQWFQTYAQDAAAWCLLPGRQRFLLPCLFCGAHTDLLYTRPLNLEDANLAGLAYVPLCAAHEHLAGGPKWYRSTATFPSILLFFTHNAAEVIAESLPGLGMFIRPQL